MSATLIPPQLLDSVVAHFRPQRVIVFGSVARGEAGADSDIDLLVVVDDDTPKEAFSAQSVYQARRDYHQAVDILPCRASVLKARAQAKGSFADIVLREGITVYERLVAAG
jgi:predicted nucleotidyltransferase